MKRLGFAVLILFSVNNFAQNVYLNDAQVWLKLSVQKKLSDRFSVELKNQDRFANNVSEFTRMKADLGFIFKLNQHIRLRADYVFIEKRKLSGAYSPRHRYYFAITAKKDIMRWRFSYRNLFQSQYIEPFTSEDGYIPYYYDRNKITVQYEYNKYLSFYVAEELYLPLNNPQVKGFDRSRTFVGLLYKLGKRQQLEAFFLYQAELQNDRDWFNQRNTYPDYTLARDFVYGLGYSYSF